MIKVRFVQADGSAREIEVGEGQSVMEAALNNGVPGIVADCGGNCSCATCRVFVDPAWRDRAGSAGELELEMLDLHADRHGGERLSCQIVATPDLDGLTVRVPRSQF